MDVKVEQEEKISVFYSWQSDLLDATNRQAIRGALRNAASKIESENILSLNITIDEATRNEPGSPNIPQTILDKISNSDIFVCDITTINSKSDMERKVPNPNVMYELGFAVSQLGWGRIILLFNTEFGCFPEDTPFDIDRHRASPYALELDKDKKTTLKKIGPLTSLLNEALTAIIVNNPDKPSEGKELSPEERKRKRDISNINWAISTLHLPSLDHHITQVPRCIDDRIFYFWESFKGVVSNSLFHLYDKKIDSLMKKFYTEWETTISFGQHYHMGSNVNINIFSNPMDAPLNKEQEQDWNTIALAAKKLYSTKNDLLDYLRNEYIEVDIDDCNNKAWQEYVSFQEKQNKLMEL